MWEAGRNCILCLGLRGAYHCGRRTKGRAVPVSNIPPSGKPVDPDNPYNIDFERERRLKRMFQILIGAGLGVAFVLLVIGYMMDALIASKTGDIAPVTPYSTPGAPAPSSQVVDKQ